ncbi:MAG: FAD-dependent monooxygenase [Candidatus Accumulibacter sp.]|uniref:FAD-dependent monooxygenase n=1 Tax=Accumulibacter sp. TaxID=2053492 RepID=UPI0019DEC911|nr:FAD-dependent monooxygenase [Accumulibacter sp.]MBE2258436.1 FAD-dependent monooxygenase [Paracoccaceae bacterium]MCB1941340.1 FAD-dependent monooxygenase [Accumulibacter sp.]MCP5247496.1 FAD-dependent monooxygenase [Accumulibacter sp.]
MTEQTERVDIAIVGAGPVGMTLALALAGGPHRVLLIDSRERGAWAGDPRALALSQGTRQLLERLGAWNAAAATAIETIHVSQRGGFGRTLIDARDYDLPALGYVMRYRDLAATLDARIDPRQLLNGCAVTEVSGGLNAAQVTLADNGASRRISAGLVVHAEGTPGYDPDVQVFDYRQHAVVAEVRPAPAHARRAWERFTPAGPLALLPLGQDYSLVFTMPPDKAAQLLALDEGAFLAALRAQFGSRMDFVASGPRASFPLALRVRQQLSGARQVWIGNAAQSLHPVSGQGFNLGLRDAWELAEALLANATRDAGENSTLTSYARARCLDRQGSIAFTDGIVRLFGNDRVLLRSMRGAGLLALDVLPPLRHFIAKRMIWGARAWP